MLNQSGRQMYHVINDIHQLCYCDHVYMSNYTSHISFETDEQTNDGVFLITTTYIRIKFSKS